MAVKRQPGPVWPWDQVPLEREEISALKAVSAQAFAAIEKLCGLDRSAFYSGGEDGRRATDFAHGKLWVGNTLRGIRAMKLPAPKAPSDPHAVPKGPPPGET